MADYMIDTLHDVGAGKRGFDLIRVLSHENAVF